MIQYLMNVWTRPARFLSPVAYVFPQAVEMRAEVFKQYTDCRSPTVPVGATLPTDNFPGALQESVVSRHGEAGLLHSKASDWSLNWISLPPVTATCVAGPTRLYQISKVLMGSKKKKKDGAALVYLLSQHIPQEFSLPFHLHQWHCWTFNHGVQKLLKRKESQAKLPLPIANVNTALTAVLWVEDCVPRRMSWGPPVAYTPMQQFWELAANLMQKKEGFWLM